MDRPLKKNCSLPGMVDVLTLLSLDFSWCARPPEQDQCRYFVRISREGIFIKEKTRLEKRGVKWNFFDPNTGDRTYAVPKVYIFIHKFGMAMLVQHNDNTCLHTREIWRHNTKNYSFGPIHRICVLRLQIRWIQ